MTTATAEGTQQPEIYGVKCKTKTVSRDIEQVTMKNCRPATRARCTVCGSGKYGIGGI